MSSQQACHERKHHMCDCRTPKQRFVDKACDSKSHPTKLWRVIGAKLNIGKKITRLRIMRLNREKSSMFPNLSN